MTTSDQPQMMPLRVTRNDRIADGIHLMEFRSADGRPLAEFSAGAHITIRVPNGLMRKYSLCNDPAERDHYAIAVKRETTGRGGSANLIDTAKAGDELMVAAPVNDFGLPQRAQDFLFIAGGIGITPIMAMIRQVQAEGKRFRLFYCTRSPETTAFLDELSKPEFKDKVKPRASLLLRAAAADGSRAQHDRSLVVGGRALRGVQRGGDAQADRQTVQGAAGALRRGHRGTGEQDHSRSATRPWPRGSEFLRDWHLRHLPHQAAGGTSRSSRSGARAPAPTKSPSIVKRRDRGGYPTYCWIVCK
jgi:ferredoxin-NADP reductase